MYVLCIDGGAVLYCTTWFPCTVMSKKKKNQNMKTVLFLLYAPRINEKIKIVMCTYPSTLLLLNVLYHVSFE